MVSPQGVHATTGHAGSRADLFSSIKPGSDRWTVTLVSTNTRAYMWMPTTHLHAQLRLLIWLSSLGSISALNVWSKLCFTSLYALMLFPFHTDPHTLCTTSLSLATVLVSVCSPLSNRYGRNTTTISIQLYAYAHAAYSYIYALQHTYSFKPCMQYALDLQQQIAENKLYKQRQLVRVHILLTRHRMNLVAQALPALACSCESWNVCVHSPTPWTTRSSSNRRAAWAPCAKRLLVYGLVPKKLCNISFQALTCNTRMCP